MTSPVPPCRRRRSLRDRTGGGTGVGFDSRVEPADGLVDSDGRGGPSAGALQVAFGRNTAGPDVPEPSGAWFHLDVDGLLLRVVLGNRIVTLSGTAPHFTIWTRVTPGVASPLVTALFTLAKITTSAVAASSAQYRLARPARPEICLAFRLNASWLLTAISN